MDLCHKRQRYIWYKDFVMFKVEDEGRQSGVDRESQYQKYKNQGKSTF